MTTVDLGKKIRSARLRTGCSQENFAPMVGTTRRHLIRLEKGYHRPSDALLARIAEATGQPLGFFTDGARREAQEAGDDDSEAASMALALVDQIVALVAMRIAA